MKTMTKTALMTGLGVLSLAAMFGTTEVSAREYYRGYERPVYYPAPVVYSQPVVVAPAVQREFVPGHYETQCETVMVAPEHKEVKVIPAVLETRRDYFGKPYTVMITPERREEICIPARYEKVEKQIWVPGFYKDVVVQAPVCEPTPTVVVAPPPPPRGVNVAVGGGNHRNFFDLFFKF